MWTVLTVALDPDHLAPRAVARVALPALPAPDACPLTQARADDKAVRAEPQGCECH